MALHPSLLFAAYACATPPSNADNPRDASEISLRGGAQCNLPFCQNLSQMRTRAVVAYFTIAVAKPPNACFPSISEPTMCCSTSDSPQDRSNSASRSLDGGVLSMPNFSGSPAARTEALKIRRDIACDSSTSVVK
jgi:hypothetical protein